MIIDDKPPHTRDFSRVRLHKTNFIIRIKTVDKLATGGERDISVQKASLGVNPEMSISGDVVLLVDDVTTSGNSLRACRDILQKWS